MTLYNYQYKMHIVNSTILLYYIIRFGYDQVVNIQVYYFVVNVIFESEKDNLKIFKGYKIIQNTVTNFFDMFDLKRKNICYCNENT